MHISGGGHPRHHYGYRSSLKHTANTQQADNTATTTPQAQTAQDVSSLFPQTQTGEQNFDYMLQTLLGTLLQLLQSMMTQANQASAFPSVDSATPTIQRPQDPFATALQVGSTQTGTAASASTVENPFKLPDIAPANVSDIQPTVSIDNQTSVSDVTPVAAITPATANGATNGFHTEGTKIIGPDGKEFIQNGMNAKQTEWGRSTVEKEVADYAAQGFNSIRITTNIGLDRVDQFIQEAGKYNMVVQVVDEGNGSGQIMKGDELQRNIDMMAGLAEKYKDNPYVWLETQNEAGGYGTAHSQDWLDQTNQMVAAIRKTGNTNPVVIDDTGWGSGDVNGDTGQSGLLANAKELLAHGNVIGSVHVYNRNSADVAAQQITDAIQALKDAGMPVMIGEVGKHISPEIPTFGGYDATLKVAPQLGVGTLIFPS